MKVQLLSYTPEPEKNVALAAGCAIPIGGRQS